MTLFLQPLPSNTVRGLSCGRYAHVHSTGDFGNIFIHFIRGAKLSDLLFGKSDLPMFFAPIGCAVRDTIHAIIGTCRPSKVPRIDALAVPAAMGGIAQIDRARAMSDLTNQPMDTMFFSVDSDASVAAGVERKRPLYAFVGVALERLNRKGDRGRIFERRHSYRLTEFWALVNRGFLCHF